MKLFALRPLSPANLLMEVVDAAVSLLILGSRRPLKLLTNFQTSHRRN